MIEIPELHKHYVRTIIKGARDHISAITGMPDLLITFTLTETPLIFGDVAELVEMHFGYSMDVLKSKKKTDPIVLARHSLMYLCRKYLGMTLKDIGIKMGNREHTTVMSALKSISDSLEINDPQVVEKLHPLLDSFKNLVNEKVKSKDGYRIC